MTERKRPQNIELEQSLLGGLLINPEAVDKVADIVSPSDFYREAHSLIYGLIFQLYEKNNAIDISIVASLAKDKGVLKKIGGVAYLSELTDTMPSDANIVHYAKTIRGKAVARSLMDAGTTITEKGYDTEIDIDMYADEAQRLVFEASENRLKKTYSHVGDFIFNSAKQIEALYQKKVSTTGVPTGFVDLDKLTSGLQPSDLIIVAGRPSMGKTAFAMNVAKHVSTLYENPIPVGIFSMEMSKEQLMTRLFSSESGIDHSKLRNGKLSPDEWTTFTKAFKKLQDAALFIDDNPALTVMELRARARRMKKEQNIGLIVIDYLQLMRGRTGAERREQEISEISRFLKALAKELTIPVIAISQLNRAPEARENNRPRLSDLRESGAIEQDADVILFVYRDEVYNKDRDDNKGMAEIIVGKHRNGPTDTVTLAFKSECVTFVNYYWKEYT